MASDFIAGTTHCGSINKWREKDLFLGGDGENFSLFFAVLDFLLKYLSCRMSIAHQSDEFFNMLPNLAYQLPGDFSMGDRSLVATDELVCGGLHN